MGLSLGNRIINLGTTNAVFWSQGEIFIRNITANTTLNFADVVNKSIRIVINNTNTTTDFNLTFTATGKTIRNLSDIMLRVRANRTQVYEFVSDNSGDLIYCLSPLRLEAIYAP
jgi:hypothetical protein